MAKIQFTSPIEVTSQEGILAVAHQIYDREQEAFQSDINKMIIDELDKLLKGSLLNIRVVDDALVIGVKEE